MLGNTENKIPLPSSFIKIDKNTNMIEKPRLILKTRSLKTLGKISVFDNWKASLNGNQLDEISFTVHKYYNGISCPIWDDLIDLKIVEFAGIGHFEISVSYTDNTETVKSIHGTSLECELGQLTLNEFHVNDDFATSAEETDYNSSDFDENGKFIPTVFYNATDKEHSLLHRVLADKAQHWSLGYITPYIALNEEYNAERREEFQRMYTVDGTSIYDFLTNNVAKESNVIFVFNTYNRVINCYSLCDCINQETKEIMAYGIGNDTSILVSKQKLANEFNISSQKDSVKNCFRVSGGDDIISDAVRAVNMNGSNYIYQFADFQYDDMSEELRNRIKKYQSEFNTEENKNKYYGMGYLSDFKNEECSIYVKDELDCYIVANIFSENKISLSDAFAKDVKQMIGKYIKYDNDKVIEGNLSNNYNSNDFIDSLGIYSKISILYSTLSYLESSLMPNVIIKDTDAETEYKSMVNELKDTVVGVSALNNFVGITNNVEALAQIYVDARYKVEVIKDTTSYNSEEQIWKGNIRVTRVANEKDYYPPTTLESENLIALTVSDDESTFIRQKIDKALSKGSMLNIDLEVQKWEEDKKDIKDYFNLYSLNRLKSFYDGYESCLSTLDKISDDSEVKEDIYPIYVKRKNAVQEVLDKRQEQVQSINKMIFAVSEEQNKFQLEWNFQSYLGEELYKEFCMYRREESYQNSNYISDNLSFSECLSKAKELLDVAEQEIKKSCVLQRTFTVSLNNLLVLPEFESLYDSFALYNYIRVKTEDEIAKVRIIAIEFSGNSIQDINVTFSEDIVTLDGNVSDFQSILQQVQTIATSYSSTALQAKQGAQANNQVSNIYINGLDASKAMITNNDSNEITITNSGILCKRMDDEGVYGEKQLRIVGNGIYMTDDNWENMSEAIGEIVFNDKLCYGVIAEKIVGNLIHGENVVIGNDDVTINKDGLIIKGGYLDIFNEDTNVEVLIDPNNETNKNNVFAIKKGSETKIGFNSDGDAILNGTVQSQKGKIGSLNIDENKLYFGRNDVEPYNEVLNFDSDKSMYYCDYTYYKDNKSEEVEVKLYYYIDKKSLMFPNPFESEWSYEFKYNTILTNDNNVISFTDNDKITFIYVDKKPYINYSGVNWFLIGGTDTYYYYIEDIDGKKCKYYILSNVLYFENDLGEQIGLGICNKEEYEGVLPIGYISNYSFDDAIEVSFSNETKIFSITEDKFNVSDYIEYNQKEDKLRISNISSNLTPRKDSKYSVGEPALRWSQLYASSSAISTSDRNQKTNISYNIDKYIELFDKLKPCQFTFLNGTSGRVHLGYIAQDVEDVMNELGITDLEFAGLCKDKLEDGTYIYSLRYDEFEPIYDAKIKQLEKRIEQMEALIKEKS